MINLQKNLLAATAYGDPCTETLQCSVYLLTGSVCEAGVCICGEGFHYIHGRCYQTSGKSLNRFLQSFFRRLFCVLVQKFPFTMWSHWEMFHVSIFLHFINIRTGSSGLGEPCSADVFCYVNADNEATSCINGVCECSDGFYKREYRTCRRIGYSESSSRSGIPFSFNDVIFKLIGIFQAFLWLVFSYLAEGDDCAIDQDCQFTNGFCDNSTYLCATYNTTTARLSETIEEDDRVERNLNRDDGDVSKCHFKDFLISLSILITFLTYSTSNGTFSTMINH